MTRDALSHRLTGARVQKPTALKTSLVGVICALALVGCGTTPIDAVKADAPAPDKDPENVPTTSPACSEPTAGRFTLSLQSACLRRGDLTSVFGNAAFLTELSADCTTARAQWDLTPALEGTFTLRNVEDQLSLDVRAASDLPGTPIILYDPNTLDNQRFWFRSRAHDSYELAPRHAPTLCAEARGTDVEIWPCDTNNTAQAFRFARVSCM
jgi:hypothetical protein